MAKSTILRAKNNTGATLAAGTVVYISGFDEGEGISTIGIASNDSSSRMPAIGIVREDIINGESDVVKISGPAYGIDTSGYVINTEVYVGINGSVAFTNPITSSSIAITQKIGIVKTSEIDGLIQLFPVETESVHATQHHTGGKDLIDHSLIRNLSIDTHKQYSLVNGSRAFTGVIGGITPATSSHLTTKAYVDARDTAIYTTGQEHYAQHSDAIITIRKDLDGYLVLAGVSGGQTIIGGVDSGDNLTLQSTAHITKGKILFGTSAYDEVNNRLGIGTVDPEPALHINTDGSYSKFMNDSHSATNWHGSQWATRRSRGTRGSPLAVANGDIIGRFDFQACDENGWNYTDTAQFAATVDGVVSTDVVPSRLNFDTTNSAGSYDTRMTIKGSGRVGIGESSPDALLEVSTASDVGVQAVTIDQNDEDKPFIDYQGATGASVTASISTHGTPGALEGWVQIEINGDKKWMPYYADPSA